ncbi:hypothetical protein CAPTEDRAFT_187925 [Capitella teleta]|uniref:Apple domain-containing protein n=1 Tax=Capitella teleta TaxID=283909 RepID=R7U426_CAPTE|nr:hypothetical protein CAPTEDRAFT_187925 [Capitella teleta]|eukprot:ELU01100.1 hypothetical protein CAPTEDRAFT_187925 [Capitella teleta]
MFRFAFLLSLVVKIGAMRLQTAQSFSQFQLDSPVLSESLLSSKIECVVRCTQTDNCAAVDVTQKSSSVLCKLRDKIQASTPVLLVTNPSTQQFILGKHTWKFISHADTCIRDLNDIVLYGISLDECKAACENERTFFCRTVEWKPATSNNPIQNCHLSRDWKDSVPADAWRNPCHITGFDLYERVYVN